MEQPHGKLPESCCCSEKRRKRKKNDETSPSIKVFRSSILRTKKIRKPEIQLGNISLQEIEDFSSHIMDILEEDIILLQKKSKREILSVRDLETVLKLSLSNNLYTRASEFAKNSVDNYFRRNPESENSEEMSAEASDVPTEESVSESSNRIFAKKSENSCFKRNPESKNSAEMCAISNELSIPERSNRIFPKKSLDNCFEMNVGETFSAEASDVPIVESVSENSIRTFAKKLADNSVEMIMDSKSTIEANNLSTEELFLEREIFSKKSVDNFPKRNLESKTLAEVPAIHTEESISESFPTIFSKKSVNTNCFKMNLDPKNSPEKSEISTEESISKNSNKIFAEKSLNNCFIMNSELENSAEEHAISNEISILESSNEAKEKPKKKKKINRKASNPANFKTFILRKKKELMPALQLEKLTLKEMDDFLNHIMETFFEDIHTLQTRKKGKTLDMRDFETALKLSIPKRHAASASEFAKKAVDSYFGQILRKS